MQQIDPKRMNNDAFLPLNDYSITSSNNRDREII